MEVVEALEEAVVVEDSGLVVDLEVELVEEEDLVEVVEEEDLVEVVDLVEALGEGLGLVEAEGLEDKLV